MAVRKDSVQIDITFITDENRQLAKLNQSGKDLVREFKTAQKEGGNLSGVLDRIARSGKNIEGIDLSRVAPAELITRARQLKTILDRIPSSAPQAAQLQQEYKRINDRLAEIRQSTRGVVAENNRLKAAVSGALSVFGGISLSNIVSGFGQLARSVIQTSTNFEKFEAVLTNTLGSRSEAQRALKELQDFAASTPFQLEELTASYIKLVNRGIKPTQDDLRLLGDIAASQGKEFDQLVEAVLDAGTGEFERLKEFGIRAKKDGDTVQLAFKGITKEVANSEEAITKAILEFGKFEGVLGSTEAISRTRAGRISNLADSISRLFANLGSGYLGTVFDLALGGISKLVNGLAGLTEQENKASDSVAQLQFQFNAQIETLKRGNLSQENRKTLIEQINARYGEYLPNLITEASTLEDIAAAQEQANKTFQQRILILSAQEALQETNKALLESTREQLRLEEQLSIQQAKLTQARERDAERADRLLPGAEQNRNQAQVQAAIRRINADIAEQAQLQQRLQQEFQRSIAAANELGVDIEAALSGSTGGSGGGGGGGGGGSDLAEKALDNRLKSIEAFFQRSKLLTDRALLQQELTEAEHGRRLLELQRDRYQQQITAFEQYNQAQSVEAEKARNELIQIEQLLGRSATPVAQLGTRAPQQVERRGINAGLDAIAADEEDALTRLRRQFERALIAENDYRLSRLELRRSFLEEEIALLRTGNEAEVQEAAKKAEELKEIDMELAAERIRIAKEEAEVKNQINQAAIGFFSDSIDLGIELLAQDEKARKENISVIRSLQRGKIISSGIAEIQKIWEKSAEFGPLQSVVAAFQTAAALARTTTALTRLNRTKFAARGISLFGDFGGRPHSQGGTQGVFSDGTQVEVERDESFVVLNRRASGVLRALSTLNQATGGVSLLSGAARLRYESGGVAPLNTTPGANVAPLGISAGLDLSPLLAEFRQFREAFARFPTQLTAVVSYTDIETAAGDVSSVRTNSSV